MQTLKTAAIVVLLMTVMYGAYVSLTTPPEPLPADVQTMLEFNDEGSFVDSGLPDSLGELGLRMDTPADNAVPADPAATASPYIHEQRSRKPPDPLRKDTIPPNWQDSRSALVPPPT